MDVPIRHDDIVRQTVVVRNIACLVYAVRAGSVAYNRYAVVVRNGIAVIVGFKIHRETVRNTPSRRCAATVGESHSAAVGTQSQRPCSRILNQERNAVGGAAVAWGGIGHLKRERCGKTTGNRLRSVPGRTSVIGRIWSELQCIEWRRRSCVARTGVTRESDLELVAAEAGGKNGEGETVEECRVHEAGKSNRLTSGEGVRCCKGDDTAGT